MNVGGISHCTFPNVGVFTQNRETSTTVYKSLLNGQDRRYMATNLPFYGKFVAMCLGPFFNSFNKRPLVEAADYPPLKCYTRF
jgi:hypothetical protein